MEHLERPHFMLALNVFAGGTDAEARRLKTSMPLAFPRLRTGRPGRLPRPVDRIENHLDPGSLANVEQALACSAVGSPETVRGALHQFVSRFDPEEVILTGQIDDHTARLRSFEIAAAAMTAEPSDGVTLTKAAASPPD